MMTEKRIVIARQAECVLEFATDCERWLDFKWKLDRIRRISATATQIDNRRWTMDDVTYFIVPGRWSMVHPDNRIIATHVDLSIVNQECISKWRKSLQRIFFID